MLPSCIQTLPKTLVLCSQMYETRLSMLLKITFQPEKVCHTHYPYFSSLHMALFHTTTPAWTKVMAYHLALHIIVCASNCIIVGAPMCGSIPICISTQSQVCLCFVSLNLQTQATILSTPIYTSGILFMLSREFLLLVIIACIVAIPVTWWAMHAWLQDFAYRTPISWWIFLLAGVLALVIALFTVSFQAIKAALANPVKSLRTE